MDLLIKSMEKKLKKCKHCSKEFNIKEKNRIVLEFWRDHKHLSRLYFCGKKCFIDFLKEKGII